MAPGLKIRASVQDWFFDAISLGHDQTIRLLVELDGMLDVPRLRLALRHLLESEPVLQCRLASGVFRAFWRTREDVDEREVSPRRELCELVVTDDPARAAHAFMVRGINPRVDPLVQIGVFRATTDTVCVKVSHVVMDGGSLKKLVERLTTAYRGLAREAASVLPLDLALDRDQGQVLRGFSFRERMRAFLTQPFHEKRWHFPFLEGQPSDITFSERTLSLRVPELRARTRARGTTVTDAFLAGFVRSVFEMTETPVNVPLPFTRPSRPPWRMRPASDWPWSWRSLPSRGLPSSWPGTGCASARPAGRRVPVPVEPRCDGPEGDGLRTPDQEGALLGTRDLPSHVLLRDGELRRPALLHRRLSAGPRARGSHGEDAGPLRGGSRLPALKERQPGPQRRLRGPIAFAADP